MTKASQFGFFGSYAAMLVALATPLHANDHGVSAASTGSTTGSTSGAMVSTSTTGSTSNGIGENLINGGFGGTATTTGTVCIDGGFGCSGINVPEPSGAALLALGVGIYAGRTIRRRRRKSA